MKKLFGIFLALLCTLSISAREVYLVGDATPAGWNLGELDKTQMTEVSTDVFEWTGVLSATPTGEGFKILTQRDWNPGIHPSEAGLKIDVAGQDVVALPYSGDPDTKWQVSKTAEYTIRVTFRAEDVLVECEEQGAVDVGVPCVDGVYQLSTAENAAKFADGINGGLIENNCKVVLTQDLDLTSIEKWVAIGTDSKKFMGTFDGQGHRILNMHIDGSKKEQGFFGVVGPGALIKNTVVDASCVIVSTDGQCMAAFVGCVNNDGTITFENCGNEANITGTKQNNAAFVGCNYGGGCHLEFYNCYNVGNISGGWENGAFSGWCGGGAKFFNCYNAGNVTEGETWARGSKEMTNCYQTVGADGGVEQVDAALLASGELCYRLNGDQSAIAWYQTLGEDEYPVLATTHGVVYLNNGEYTNTDPNAFVLPQPAFAIDDENIVVTFTGIDTTGLEAPTLEIDLLTLVDSEGLPYVASGFGEVDIVDGACTVEIPVSRTMQMDMTTFMGSYEPYSPKSETVTVSIEVTAYDNYSAGGYATLIETSFTGTVGVTTGISNVTTQSNSVLYNVAGQRVNAVKGIVIKDGKKFIVK